MRVLRNTSYSAAVLVAAVAAFCPAVRAAKPDLSNPKSAVISMGRAMMADDVDGAVTSSNVTAEQKPIFEQVVHVTAAMHKMEQAAVKKWGEDGRTVVQGARRPA